MTSIGYYVHHHGVGHRHRFESIAAALPSELDVVPISQIDLGAGCLLPNDAPAGPTPDATARGGLHWAPITPIATDRLKTLVDWLHDLRPAGVVVDVSVEALIACRLAGVPTVTIRQHGDRSDRPHRLGYDTARAILAPLPCELGWNMPDRGRVQFTGFIPPVRQQPSRTCAAATDDVVVLWGRGGGSLGGRAVDAIAASVSGSVLCVGDGIWADGDEPTAGNVARLGWVHDVAGLLERGPSVVSSAGINSVATAAAARCPLVVVPQDRPFDEQRHMAHALDGACLAVSASTDTDENDWRSMFATARRRSVRWSEVSVDGARVAADAIVEALL